MTVHGAGIPTKAPWRGAIAIRVITLGYAIGVVVSHREMYERPWLAWTVLAIMIAWTVVTTVVYSQERLRRRWFFVVDVGLTFALMPLTRLTHTDQMLVEHAPLITTLWVCGALFACAVNFGTIGGLTSGVVLSVGTALANKRLDLVVLSDTVLLMLAGTVTGMCVAALTNAGAERAQAMRIEAATAERERLARSIHDGVLQVLAQIRRRAHADPRLSDLADIAAEQEVALRALVATGSYSSAQHAGGEEDLNRQLQVLATSKVQVSTPAGKVLLPSTVAAELVAVVREALSNVQRHAGADAKAWVLLEDLGDEVTISVRDNGAGIADGRLDEAAAQGRLGVAQSIKGRVRDLGGTATLDTAVGAGTEWEIQVPRESIRKDAAT